MDRWIAEEKQRQKEQRLSQLRNVQPVTQAVRPSTARVAHVWQAFDVVHHPTHGQGIVVSTTTT